MTTRDEEIAQGHSWLLLLVVFGSVVSAVAWAAGQLGVA